MTPATRPATASRALWIRLMHNVLFATLLLAAMGTALLPLPAAASVATLTLSPAVGPPSTVTVATGSGFAPGERVVLGFDHRRLETTQAGADGTFVDEVKVPATATPGDHTVSAKGPVSGTALAAFTVRTDWPTARFVPEGTGHNPYENVLSVTNVGDLELAWSFQTEGPVNTTPIVVDGVVYVAGQVAGTGGSEVNAVDAATGELVWSEKDSGFSPSDLAVAEGVLYVSSITGHILRAYDAATGELLWEFPGPTRAPTVVEGVVYAADHLRSLWSLDAETGRRLWTAHVPFGGYGFGVAVAGGTVYAGGTALSGGPSAIYAYDGATGTLKWRTPTGGRVDATPAVAIGTVYAGSADQLFYALSANAGRVLWTADSGGLGTSAPAVADGAVYFGSSEGNVHALDAESGEELGVTPTGGSINHVHAAIVANGVVYVGSVEGIEHAFNAVTGDLLWSYSAGGNVFKQSVVDGTLYVTSSDTNLYAFRLPGA